MDPLTAAAANGLQVRMDSIDLLANNLANTSTSGFKADREFYSTFLSSEALDSASPAVGDSPLVKGIWTDFTQGSLFSTSGTTDLGLSGRGFFTVQGPNGRLYTRNGAFKLSPQGGLVTSEGYPVLLAGGQPLTLRPDSPMVVGLDGTVTQNGAALGQLELADFAEPARLEKVAGTYFQNPDPLRIKPQPAQGFEVAQGKLESSNAAPTEAAARMVTLLRHFEMLQHAVKIGADMNKQALEEVARVGS